MKKLAVFSVLGLVLIFDVEIKQTYAAAGSPTAIALAAHPAPFSGSEIFNQDNTPFYKWTNMISRMDARQKPLQPWLDNRKILEGLSPRDRLQKVGEFINKFGYIEDITNWGASDYWETPAQFFSRAGGGGL